jgi:hypothetical protein
MQRRPKRTREAEAASDLSFPVPFIEQAKYLTLADRFLESGSDPRSHKNAQAIDSARHFHSTKSAKKKAA